MKTANEIKKVSQNYELSSPESTVSQAWRAGAKWMAIQMEFYAKQHAIDFLADYLGWKREAAEAEYDKWQLNQDK